MVMLCLVVRKKAGQERRLPGSSMTITRQERQHFLQIRICTSSRGGHGSCHTLHSNCRKYLAKGIFLATKCRCDVRKKNNVRDCCRCSSENQRHCLSFLCPVRTFFVSLFFQQKRVWYLFIQTLPLQKNTTRWELLLTTPWR